MKKRRNMDKIWIEMWGEIMGGNNGGKCGLKNGYNMDKTGIK